MENGHNDTGILKVGGGRVNGPRSCASRDEAAAGCVVWKGWIASRGFDPAPVPRSCPVKAVAGKMFFATGVPDRVAPGGCPPGAPTDPNVRD